MKEIDEIEKALEPKRMMRIALNIFITVMLFITLVMAVKMSLSAINSAETVSRDHAWFKLQAEKIQGLEHQIIETQQELEAVRKSANKRWISRSDDRVQIARLTNLAISLKAQYVEAISGYNVAADLAQADILESLPKKIDIKEFQTREREDDG